MEGNQEEKAAERTKAVGRAQLIIEQERLKMEAERQKQEAKPVVKEKSASVIEDVTAMPFDGSADDIAADLNIMFTQFKKTPSGPFAFASKDARILRKTILEKIEFGLLKFSKVDADSAAFFQKKAAQLSQSIEDGLAAAGKKKEWGV
jgi:hypothetical protein